MISYLVIEPLPPVYTGRSPRGPASPEKLGKRAARLHVQDLRDTRSRKDVVTTSHALTEPKRGQQRPQIVEPDVGVSSALKHLQQNLLPHTLIRSEEHTSELQ